MLSARTRKCPTHHFELPSPRQPEAYLNVTFGEVKIILFKAGPEPRAELVAKARAEEVVVRESTMSPPMQASAIERGRRSGARPAGGGG